MSTQLRILTTDHSRPTLASDPDPWPRPTPEHRPQTTDHWPLTPRPPGPAHVLLVYVTNTSKTTKWLYFNECNELYSY